VARVLFAATPVGAISVVFRQIVAAITGNLGLSRRDQLGQRPAHVRGEEIPDARHASASALISSTVWPI
jgi:hypothetical protein